MTDRSNDFVSPSTTTSTPALMGPPRCCSPRSDQNDSASASLPAAIDPLRRDGQPAGGEQWFAFAALTCLLIEEY
jgi:hypothetical protein